MTVNTLPANLPDAPDAKLPATYEAAQKALVDCTRVDEAWTWQNKAAALAAYARMARDNQLRDMALRIQARAIHRAGELLRIIPAAGGARTDIEPRDGTDPRLTRKAVAEEAGMSERQRKTALRVASIPEPEFNRQIEGPNPPTITRLVEQGTASRPVMTSTDLDNRPDPVRAAKAYRTFTDIAAFCSQNDPAELAMAFTPEDSDSLREIVTAVDRWLDLFVVNLPEYSTP